MKILRKLIRLIGIVPYIYFLRVKHKVIIKPSVRFNSNTRFEGGNVIHPNSIVTGTHIGYGTYLGADCWLSDAIIGRFCCIANDVKVITATHPTTNFVSIHPAFFSLKKQSGFTYVDKQLFSESLLADSNHSVIIGNDVWIGTCTKIMGGIRIGDGAVIAMGSVVTKDVEPYSIVGGVPAKIIRYRFKKEQIDFLSNFQWWNKSDAWLKENADKFSDIAIFINNFKSA
jgi:acetyltransferase-like isoleucine patch superfamily enzyme